MGLDFLDVPWMDPRVSLKHKDPYKCVSNLNTRLLALEKKLKD